MKVNNIYIVIKEKFDFKLILCFWKMSIWVILCICILKGVVVDLICF